jgi:hypothetical protein
MYEITRETLDEVELEDLHLSLTRTSRDGVVDYDIGVYGTDSITESRLVFNLTLSTDEATARSVFAHFTKDGASSLWEDS